jgi:hypothetical protein
MHILMAWWLVIALLKMDMKLEKNMRRLSQWWWCHWNAILVIILNMSLINARRRRPTPKGRGDAEMSTPSSTLVAGGQHKGQG